MENVELRWPLSQQLEPARTCSVKEPVSQNHIYVKIGNRRTSQLAVSSLIPMNGTHIYFLWTKYTPKITDEQSLPLNQNLANKSSSGCCQHGRGEEEELPLFLKTKLYLKFLNAEKEMVQKRLWSSLCSAQSTNSFSQVSSYWITHFHLTCPMVPTFLWPFLSSIRARDLFALSLTKLEPTSRVFFLTRLRPWVLSLACLFQF